MDDLESLRDIVGDARVVALGESSHTAREQLRLKHRLIEYLALEMDFTVLALEESAACCARINSYILEGVGDLEDLLSSMGLWEAWDTEEMSALFMWMREHNSRLEEARKLRFHGIDIGFPLLGIEDALTFLDGVDPHSAEGFRGELGISGLYSTTSWMQTVRRYERLSDGERIALSADLARLVALLEARRAEFEARSSRASYEWAHHQAVIATDSDAMYAAIADGAWVNAINSRDEAMARNLQWILDVAEPEARVVLWAHNGHIAKVTRTVPDPRFDGPIIPMGKLLDGGLGASLVSVGFTFNRGTDRVAGTSTTTELAPAHADSLDGALARIGLPAFLLDLRNAPQQGPVADWLIRRRKVRYFTDYEELIPCQSFDVLVYVDTIAPSRPNRASAKRIAQQ